MNGFCKICGQFGELNRHHVLHRIQGGEGIYIQTVHRSGCHPILEENTENAAKCLFDNPAQLGEQTSFLGSVNVNGRCMQQTAQQILGVISGVSYNFDDSCCDLRVYDLNGNLVANDRITVLGSCSFYVVGSPAPTSPVIVVANKLL